MELSTGNLTVMENEGRTCNKQHMDLGKPSSYLHCPTSRFAHLQYQVEMHSELGVWRDADLEDPHMMSFA